MSEHENETENADDAAAIDAINETSDDLASGEGDTDAEPDATDGEDAPAPQSPPEQDDAATAMDSAEVEKGRKKIETARANFYKRVEEVMGDEFQHLVLCPACSDFVPGLVFHAEFADEVKVELWPFLGLPDPNMIADAPDRHVCPTCVGRGQLKSGSLVPEYAIVNCRACLGRGYTDDVLPVNEPASGNGNVQPGSFDQTPPMPEDEAWIQAARARGYTVVPPFEQPHA